MRIIEHGDKPIFNSKCEICNCEFEFGITDIEKRKFSVMTGKYFVRCPECGICYDVTTDRIKSIIRANRIKERLGK